MRTRELLEEGEEEKNMSRAAMGRASSPRHMVLFPFMSKGHMIPFINFAHLLHERGLRLTFVTTPSNAPFVRLKLGPTPATLVELPFPANFPGLPSGVESTDQLPSMSLFIPFVEAVKLLRPHFERVLENLPRIDCIVSDGFLGWTLESASKLGLPRLVLYGMNNFATTVSALVSRDRPHKNVSSDDQPFFVSSFPGMQFTKADFPPPFNDPEPSGPMHDFVMEQVISTSQSWGILANSFYELEPEYVDCWNKEFHPKSWCIGPLCLAEPPTAVEPSERPYWVQWLGEQEGPVLYVAFGSQAEVSPAQLLEIAIGLEKSNVSFLWAAPVRGGDKESWGDFEERIAKRGLVVRQWVHQSEILRHQKVQGFLSHCGWNSASEGLCAGVPLLAWPMLAEQFLNAKMLVEKLGVGLRIGRRGWVGRETVEEMVRELMLGENGKKAREKAKVLAEAAMKAMDEGGSSCCTIDEVIDSVCDQTKHPQTIPTTARPPTDAEIFSLSPDV